jgi:hypothetical protein
MYKTLIAYGNTSRREDLEDMLADPAYFQAIFHTLSSVKELYKGQAELGRANGTIASALTSKYLWFLYISYEDTRAESRSSGRTIQTTFRDQGCL